MVLLLPYKIVTRKGRKVTKESQDDGFPWKPLPVGDHPFLKAPQHECTKGSERWRDGFLSYEKYSFSAR